MSRSGDHSRVSTARAATYTRRPGAFTDEATGEVAGRAASRGICRYVKVAMWYSEAMYALPQKGRTRLVYLYLLTGPHTLGFHVPGLYQVGKQALREALSLGPQEFSTVTQALRECVGMKTDFDRGMVWLPTALEHLGPPANPNIVRGYCRALLAMPKSPLILDAVAAYRPFLGSLGKVFLKPLEDAFPTVCQTTAEPFRIENREEIKEIQSASEMSPQEGGLVNIRAILESLH